MEKLTELMMNIGDKLNNNTILRVLRDAFMLAFPLTIFGSITLIIANFPYLSSAIGEGGVAVLQNWLGPAATATMSITTIWVCLGIGYYMCKEKEVDPIFGAVVCLAAFFLLIPFEMTLDGGELVTNIFAIDRLGAKSMFVGMIGSFLASYIYIWVTKKNWTIKMPPQVPPAVAKSFTALIPACLTLAVFLVIRIIFLYTPWTNLPDFIYQVLQAPLTSLGEGLAATLIVIFVCQILWFFGLHGQIIVNSVMDPIWNTLTLDNLAAFQAGEKLPHLINKQFMEIFTVGLGGTGSTLIVVILLIFFMKSKQMKEVGKLAAPAGIFNVNEPVIFGMPIVMNPMVAIPWIVAPMLATLVAYICMAIGLCPYTTGVSVPWTTPVLLNSFLATNSIMGPVVQLLQMAVIALVWFPFLKAMDRQNLAAEDKEAPAQS